MKRIFLVAPSFACSHERIEKAISFLGKNFSVEFRKDIFSEDEAFAGSVERRADEMNEALASGSDIIWAIRGGYGASQIIRKIRFGKGKKKILAGFSDFTVIGAAAADAGHDFLYCPMPYTYGKQRIGFDIACALLSGNDLGASYAFGPEPGRKITGTAKVFCLSLLVNLIGTPYMPSLTPDTVLFLEDVKEKAYALDRYIMHLFNAGVLGKARAVFLDFTGVLKPEQVDIIKSLRRVYRRPVFTSFPFGHCHEALPVPYGYKVIIDEKNITFTRHSHS